MKKQKKMIGFFVLLPSIVCIAIFVYGFISWTVRASFSDWNGSRALEAIRLNHYNFVGMENYQKLFTDWRFQTDLWNTLFFTIFFLFGCLALGIILASLLDSKIRGGRIFQNIFLFPMAISFVVTGTVWGWFFAPGNSVTGPLGINLLFEQLGWTGLQWEWYTSVKTIGPLNLAIIPVAIAAVWQFSGYTMAMFLAAMRGIPEALTEAAKVDGANSFQIFWRIKFPLLKPITLSAMIILGHISLKIFDLVYAMTGSGPNNVTDFPAIYMYNMTFERSRYARGSGIAVIMLLMVAVVIIPYLLSTFRKEA